ncbi:MAG: helix-turn-helix domain-containing protein, partial [Muribaculaceae bacterium]|nr:helix-turn-helix domain-containing protein [Muribaculaceae bacterium]
IDRFFTECRNIIDDKTNPYRSQAFLFELTSFIFKTIYKWFDSYKDEVMSNQGRMTDQFLILAQQNFKHQRFLDFYAQKLEVTPKHLSRTLKSQTGYTAVEWIERFVILEAKVLLKSSNLNIQQISDELNFPSQSFFGKYFKKLTGMSPKEFRNS